LTQRRLTQPGRAFKMPPSLGQNFLAQIHLYQKVPFSKNEDRLKNIVILYCFEKRRKFIVLFLIIGAAGIKSYWNSCTSFTIFKEAIQIVLIILQVIKNCYVPVYMFKGAGHGL